MLKENKMLKKSSNLSEKHAKGEPDVRGRQQLIVIAFQRIEVYFFATVFFATQSSFIPWSFLACEETLQADTPWAEYLDTLTLKTSASRLVNHSSDPNSLMKSSTT